MTPPIAAGTRVTILQVRINPGQLPAQVGPLAGVIARRRAGFVPSAILEANTDRSVLPLVHHGDHFTRDAAGQYAVEVPGRGWVFASEFEMVAQV